MSCHYVYISTQNIHRSITLTFWDSTAQIFLIFLSKKTVDQTAQAKFLDGLP